MAKLNDDFHDLLSAFTAEKARFLVVGAYAVAVHGRPRTTKDIDLWVEASRDNAARVMRALRAFGAPLGDLREEELQVEGTGFHMGVPPRRIDVLIPQPRRIGVTRRGDLERGGLTLPRGRAW